MSSEQGQLGKPQIVERTAASGIAMMLVQRSLDNGEPLTISSRHIVFARVNDAFSKDPRTPEEVTEGFRAAFPNSPISSSPEDNPNVVTVTYKEAKGSRSLSKAYVAVNTTGSAPHTDSERKRYLVVRGELIVTLPKIWRKSAREHILQPAEEYTVEPEVVHAVRARNEGWTIFQATSYSAEEQLNPFKKLLRRRG